ncbi:MAG: hypothetical protein H7296_08785 [Bacteroidia bacterium]|nr:hypothetical protein [Bacteroidia bacterium]
MKGALVVKVFLVAKEVESNRLLLEAYGRKYADCLCNKKSECAVKILQHDDRMEFKILSID